MRKEVIGAATLPVVAIYALCDPDWTPRYVGKTTQYLHERHKAHIRDAKRGGKRPVSYWIRKRIAGGDPLCIRLLEYVQPGGNWASRESFWIDKHRQSGRLLNLTNGGEGLSGHRFSEEHRQRIAAALRTGRHFECEVCGSRFWRKQHAIKNGENRFCSRRCSNSRHKGPGMFHA